MIATFARFDLLSWLPRRQTLVTLALVVAVGAILPIPGMAIVAAAMVTSLMVSTPFLADERGSLNTLYGVLPVTRTAVVTGRAISIAIYFLIATTLAAATTVLVATLQDEQVSPGILLVSIAAGAAFAGISMALQVPVFFRVGYSRGRLMAYAPSVVVAGLAWLLQALRLHTPMLEAISHVPVAVVVTSGLALGAAGFLIAVSVSSRLFRTREL